MLLSVMSCLYRLVLFLCIDSFKFNLFKNIFKNRNSRSEFLPYIVSLRSAYIFQVNKNTIGRVKAHPNFYFLQIINEEYHR